MVFSRIQERIAGLFLARFEPCPQAGGDRREFRPFEEIFALQRIVAQIEQLEIPAPRSCRRLPIAAEPSLRQPVASPVSSGRIE